MTPRVLSRALAGRPLRAHGTAADHVVPSTGGSGGSATLDGLDTWGTWRHAALLSACALRDDAAACAIVDGRIEPAIPMGSWLVDDTTVTPAIGTEDPASTVTVGPDYTFSVDDAYPCDGDGATP